MEPEYNKTMEEQASFHPINKESIRSNNLIIEWQALEYQHKSRSNNWYWAVGIITIVCAVAATLFGNFLFALIILIGVGSLMFYSTQPPELITFSITPKGIRIKDRLYPFNNIKSFNIHDHTHGPVLVLDINKAILPMMVLPIDDENVNTDVLHQYLEAFIPEGDHHLPLAEIIIERLGF